MAHDHDHDRGAGSHAGHTHGVSADADRGKLMIALGLIVGFMLFEVVVGAIVHSLALLSDAAHMLTDAGAIGLSLVAIRLAAKPARGALTFGLKRTEILSAQFNGATLLVLALVIIYEGITRLVNPPKVGGTAVLVVALVGIVVNLAASYTLSKANRQSMNVEGAFQHILTDLAAFIFTAIAGAVILTTGFRRADGIASLVIAAIMLYAAYGLLKASGRVFLEAAPQGLDPDAIGNAMASQTGVSQVHDLHVWEITSGFPSLSAHVLVDNQCNCHAARRALETMLHDRFDLEHTTLQVDHEGGELLDIELPSRATSQSSQHAGPLDQQRATGERRTAIPIEGELVSTSQRGAGVRQVPWFRGITRTGLDVQSSVLGSRRLRSDAGWILRSPDSRFASVGRRSGSRDRTPPRATNQQRRGAARRRDRAMDQVAPSVS